MERIRKGYWTAIGMIVVWSGFTTLMLVVFPVPLFRIFIPDDHVLQTGVSYLRIMGYSQILMCLEITSSGAFQGLGRPMPPTLAGIIGLYSSALRYWGWMGSGGASASPALQKASSCSPGLW